MNQVAQETEPYVSIACAAALLGVTQVEVSDLLMRNEIESHTFVLRTSLRTYMAAGA